VCDTRDEGGDDRKERFELDGFEETELTPKLKVLTKRVNRQLCENVEVVVGRDGCFLLWDERHPEMNTETEWLTGKLGREATEAYSNSPVDFESEGEKRHEYRQLYETLPAREYKLPLTGREAFALLAACHFRPQGASLCEPSVFADQIEALLVE
jgi:hypothetical protein